MRILIGTVLLVCYLTGSRAADPVWPTPVRRQSEDRGADLLDALLRAGRFRDAERLCVTEGSSLGLDTAQAAHWAIRLSTVLSSEQLTENSYGDLEIKLAQTPVANLLAKYPEHRRHLFLRAQLISVRRDAARHQIIAVAVSPTTDRRIDTTMKDLSRATNEMLSLVDEIEKARQGLASRRQISDQPLIDDLKRLKQELQVDAVSLALMQTELFPAESQDLLSAATEAETLAGEALALMPAGSPARREIDRLRIEAILRGGQFRRAATELIRLIQTIPKPIPTSVLAMLVRSDIGRQRMPDADTRLKNYFGTSPIDAPPSIDMDLARLEFLMERDVQSNEVGAWFDAIEKRNGLYARRRAEAISLAKLRAAGIDQAVDPSLVAAQAEDWLRRGDVGRAGELFAAAADAGRDGARAIRHATQSAAAFVKANRAKDAADVLLRVSAAHRDAVDASRAHLQAAITYSSSKSPDVATRVESILLQNLMSWPDSQHATAARKWLVKILSEQGRVVDAAAAATLLSPAKFTNAQDLQDSVDRWQAAFMSNPTESLDPVAEKFRSAFAPLIKNAVASDVYRSAGSYLLDRVWLNDLPDRIGQALPADVACDSLLTFRRGGGVETLIAPPESLRPIFEWRLMRDAREFPQMRLPVAANIESWSDSPPSFATAERLIWKGNIKEAESVCRTIVDASDTPGPSMTTAASLFGSGQNESKSVAIRWWDELAGGLRQGSAPWHEAKLAAIQLLLETGNAAEAQKRAKYVLLVAPPKDPNQKRKYESSTQVASER